MKKFILLATLFALPAASVASAQSASVPALVSSDSQLAGKIKFGCKFKSDSVDGSVTHVSFDKDEIQPDWSFNCELSW